MNYTDNSFIPNFLLGLVGRWQWRELRHACRNPRKAQELTLRHILNFAKDSIYGKEHHFAEILAAKTADELFAKYRHNVPAQDYEALRPYVDRHKKGEPNVLFPGKPKMYATTSGTTNEPKWIPITNVYMNKVYSKMTTLWLYNFIRRRRKTFAGKIIFVVSKDIEGYAPDGTIVGAVSGVTQRDAPQLIRERYASVPDIFGIADYAARYYVLIRLGLQDNVTLVIMPNPSSMIEIQNSVTENYEELCNDIEKGTLSDKFDIEPEIREEIKPYLKADAVRAAELRNLKKQYGEVLPKHYWPYVQMLSTWKCGNTKVYSEKIKDWFPKDCFYQELGYFSSECRFGLVLDETNDSILFPHFHYYEFVEESELQNPNHTFWQLDELQYGKRYCPFVTTFSGLYRYNMSDLVEVGDFYKATPKVHMVQKVNGIVSMTGEKLYEGQFIDAVHEAEKEMKVKTKFFVGFANLRASAYEFYYEFVNSDTTQDLAERFSKRVDQILQRLNVEYKAKRESFRLKDPQTHRLPEKSYSKFKEKSIQDGTARDGQFKLNLLMQDEKRQKKFDEIEKEKEPQSKEK